MRLIPWSKRPNIDNKDLGDFEKLGPEAVRKRLSRQSLGLIPWSKRPNIDNKDLEDLERLGPEAVRERLSRQNLGERLFISHGPYRDMVYQWLAWKAAKAELWNKANVILALVAAVASVLAALEGCQALFPHQLS
jgi:hypothetical protein